MGHRLILASGSEIRATLLRNAGVAFDVERPRVDEESIRRALDVEGAPPRDVADTLAEMKARRISEKHPGAMVIGCDQVLDADGRILSKPASRDEARRQLADLRNRRHALLSAVVVARDGEPLWRHIGQVRLQMRNFSDSYLEAYLDRNWPAIQNSVGGYMLEEEGVRLMARVEGDYFTVLGLPLVELLGYLVVQGVLPE